MEQIPNNLSFFVFSFAMFFTLMNISCSFNVMIKVILFFFFFKKLKKKKDSNDIASYSYSMRAFGSSSPFLKVQYPYK